MLTDGGRSVLGILVVAALIGCEWAAPKPATVVTNLDITGVVTSSTTGNPIAQATVNLGVGGSFSLPTVLNSRITDAQGRYAINHGFEHPEGECGLVWIQAHATGFQSSNIESSTLRVQCVTTRQTINVALTPQP